MRGVGDSRYTGFRYFWPSESLPAAIQLRIRERLVALNGAENSVAYSSENNRLFVLLI